MDYRFLIFFKAIAETRMDVKSLEDKIKKNKETEMNSNNQTENRKKLKEFHDSKTGKTKT